MGKAIQAINLFRFAAGAHRPITGPAKATWETTYRCNSRCRHCHIWEVKDHSSELTTEEAERVIRELAEVGVQQLSLSGGETLMRQDLFQMIQLAHDLGLSTSMNTNGSLLHKYGESLIQSPIDAVYISLDGATAEMHDNVRGVKGAFEKALEAIRYISTERRGNLPRVFINFTVTSNNYHEMAAALRIARESGADGATILLAHSNGKFTPEGEMLPTYEHARRIEEEIARVKKEFGGFVPLPAEYLDRFGTFICQPNKLYSYPCIAGYSTALIKVNGEVCACPSGDFVFGSVKEQTFREVWYSEAAQAARKSIREGRHPICWTDCVAPMSIVAMYLRPWQLPKLLNPALIKHIAWKLRS